jgi:hypothetical protein
VHLVAQPCGEEGEELADIFSFAFLLAEKYGFDVKEIILEKIKTNEEKYPIDKAKGTSKKYDESDDENGQSIRAKTTFVGTCEYLNFYLFKNII